MPPKKKEAASIRQPRRGRLAAIGLASAVWMWAAALIATRHHFVLEYDVQRYYRPPLWGFFALPLTLLLAAVVIGALWAVVCWRTSLDQEKLHRRPLAWMSAALAIPALDAARAAGVDVPLTFLEPLWLALITGASVASMNWGMAAKTESWRAPGAISLAAAIGFFVWCCWQGFAAHDGFLLGFHDFGHFAYRVASTWEGRGFLLESPGVPAYWDHFNPALALLAPLWGIWPDARAFIVLQGCCLAAPAPMIFFLAHRLGCSPWASAAWSLAYLLYPAVNQMNLNYTYGWHPISCALPLLFLAACLLVSGRRWMAVIVAASCCLWKESMFMILAFFCGAMVFQHAVYWLKRREPPAVDDPASPETRLSAHFTPGGWLLGLVLLVILFVVVFKYSAFSQYQTARFAHLGSSTLEVALSPVLRPQVFWFELFRPHSIVFVLALLIPLGVRPTLRGWQVLLAAAPPLVVLAAWSHSPATSIAFQYTTTLLPTFFLAAILGSLRAPHVKSSTDGSSTDPGNFRHPAGAVAAGVTASFLFGALPWSVPTLTDVHAQSYFDDQQQTLVAQRAPGSAGNRALKAIIERIGARDSAILSSGRLATHLLHVRRLESADLALVRWTELQREAGADRSPIEVFDWVVLDLHERFQQSKEDMDRLAAEARRANYELVHTEHDILLFRRPEE